MQTRLLAAMRAPGRQVHEFPLVAKGGSRVLVRAQTAPVRGADGRPVGVYCAFGEAHAQGFLERSVALSQALFDDAAWGVVLLYQQRAPLLVEGLRQDAAEHHVTPTGSRAAAACSGPVP